MFKSQKGITLVALVITIIVMLILAGVSIQLLLEDDGVINKALTVKEEQLKSSLKEAIALANADMMMEYYQDKTAYQNEFLADTDGDGDTEVSEEKAIQYFMSKINSNFSYKNAFIYIGAEGTSYEGCPFVCYNVNGGNTVTKDTIIVGVEIGADSVIGVDFCPIEIVDDQISADEIN